MVEKLIPEESVCVCKEKTINKIEKKVNANPEAGGKLMSLDELMQNNWNLIVIRNFVFPHDRRR